MPDVLIGTTDDQHRCRFNGPLWTADLSQERKSMKGEESRTRKEDPGQDLCDGPGRKEPGVDVKQGQRQQGFECEKAKKAIGAPISQRSPREEDDWGGSQKEEHDLHRRMVISGPPKSQISVDTQDRRSMISSVKRESSKASPPKGTREVLSSAPQVAWRMRRGADLALVQVL